MVTTQGLLEQKPLLVVNVFFTNTAIELRRLYLQDDSSDIGTASRYLIRALPPHLAARNAQ